MKVFSHFAAAFAAFSLAFSAPSVAAQEQVPLAAFGALPDVEDASISPSGANIAILLTHEGTRQLFFLDSNMKLISRLAVGDAKVRYFDWVGDDQILLVTGQTEDLRGFTTNMAEFNVARLIPVTYKGCLLYTSELPTKA